MKVHENNILVKGTDISLSIARKYIDNEGLCISLSEIVEMFLKTYDNIIVNHKRETEESHMMCYLREIEKRIIDGSTKITSLGSDLQEEMKKVRDDSSRLHNETRKDMIEEIRNVKDVVKLEGCSRLGESIQSSCNMIKSDMIEEIRSVKDVVKAEGCSRLGETLQGLRSDMIDIKDVVKAEGCSRLGDTLQGQYNSIRSDMIDIKEVVKLEGCSRLGETLQGQFNNLRSEMIDDRKEMTGFVNSIKGILGEMVINVDDVVGKRLNSLNVESLRDKIGSEIVLMRKETKLDLEDMMQRYQMQMKEEVQRSLTDMMRRNETTLEEIMLKNKGNDREIYDKIKESMKLEMEKLGERLNVVEKDIQDKIMRAVSMIHEDKEVSSVQHNSILNEIQRVPMLTKMNISDKLHKVDQIEQDVKRVLNECPVMKMIHIEMERIMGKVEEISKQTLTKTLKEENNSNLKGSEGERRLLEGLSSQLLCRDGYRVESVSGKAHECDLVIRREGYRTVRIESKAYKEKVRTSEVDKFCRDLHECEDHGIFVSLHSGIVGREHGDIQQLSTGRIAIYLTNNNYDIDEIISRIHNIYMIDDIISRYNEKEEGFFMSPQCLDKLKDMINGKQELINQATIKAKEIIMIMNKLDVAAIEEVVLGNTKGNKGKEQERKECKYCGISLSKRSLSRHEKQCKIKHNVDSS